MIEGDFFMKKELQFQIAADSSSRLYLVWIPIMILYSFLFKKHVRIKKECDISCQNRSI